MAKPTDKALRVMVAAGSPASRSALGQVAVEALHGRVHLTAEAHISVERFIASGSEILVADLETLALAASLLRFLAAAPGGTGCIALIDAPDPSWVRSALRASINAILARDADAGDLLLALRAAESGLLLLHPSSVQGLTAQNFSRPADETPVEELTGRERQVLRLVSDGFGNKEIALRLSISEHTVKFHISSILGKLNATTRTEAVSLGIKRGLIPV